MDLGVGDTAVGFGCQPKRLCPGSGRRGDLVLASRQDQLSRRRVNQLARRVPAIDAGAGVHERSPVSKLLRPGRRSKCRKI